MSHFWTSRPILCMLTGVEGTAHHPSYLRRWGLKRRGGEASPLARGWGQSRPRGQAAARRSAVQFLSCRPLQMALTCVSSIRLSVHPSCLPSYLSRTCHVPNLQLSKSHAITKVLEVYKKSQCLAWYSRQFMICLELSAQSHFPHSPTGTLCSGHHPRLFSASQQLVKLLGSSCAPPGVPWLPILLL